MTYYLETFDLRVAVGGLHGFLGRSICVVLYLRSHGWHQRNRIGDVREARFLRVTLQDNGLEQSQKSGKTSFILIII
ncbi:MAG: hypothetical protein F6J93_39140 [Oscillatoria sp. SIO1A7]|nr:hypothetical protein [Oscillatoria sp. SIO1A7]